MFGKKPLALVVLKHEIITIIANTLMRVIDSVLGRRANCIQNGERRLRNVTAINIKFCS